MKNISSKNIVCGYPASFFDGLIDCAGGGLRFLLYAGDVLRIAVHPMYGLPVAAGETNIFPDRISDELWIYDTPFESTKINAVYVNHVGRNDEKGCNNAAIDASYWWKSFT
jgi:hypothetical protein